MKDTDSGLKGRKFSAGKNSFDPLECWNICRKDGTRQYSSVSKVRSRLSNHDSSGNSPIEEDRTLLSIQKKLEALSSVQTSINQDLKKNIKCSEAVSPPRQLSARRLRKGVVYRPTEKIKHNVIELKPQRACGKCKLFWISNSNKKTCELCSNSLQGLAFEIEFKMPSEENQNAMLVIGDREIPVNLNSRFKYIITVPANSKAGVERNKTFDIELDAECSEFSRIPTPSFQLNTERLLDSTQISNPASSFLAGEVSFSENCKPWQDLHKEIDRIIHKQGNVLESPSLGKIKEVCDGISSEYSKIFKKIATFVHSDIGLAIEKSSRGMSNFFESCVISLLKYVSQLQDKNSMAKDTEQKYVVRIASLTKLLQKYQENPYQKKLVNRFN